MNINLPKVVDGTVKITADIFVVPNGTWSAGELGFPDDLLKYLMELKSMNPDLKKLNPISARVCQFWMSGRGTVGSENLADHGFRILGENNEILRCIVDDTLPINFFTGACAREGGLITNVFLPVRVIGNNGEIIRSIKGNFTLRLAQREYRYRRLGTFEEALRAQMQHDVKEAVI